MKSVTKTLMNATLGLLALFAILLISFAVSMKINDVSLENLRTVWTQAKTTQYVLLSPDTASAISVATPSFNGSEGSFLTSTAFIATLGFIAILAAALRFVRKKLIQQYS